MKINHFYDFRNYDFLSNIMIHAQQINRYSPLMKISILALARENHCSEELGQLCLYLAAQNLSYPDLVGVFVSAVMGPEVAVMGPEAMFRERSWVDNRTSLSLVV